MAVKLRLMRMGKKKQPTYRVVAADSRKARNGRFIEVVGTYNPRLEPSLIEIDNERALHWLRHGAQPTERVQKLLVISGAWEEFTGQARPAAAAAPSVVTRAASAMQADAEPQAAAVATGPESATDAESASNPESGSTEQETQPEAETSEPETEATT